MAVQGLKVGRESGKRQKQGKKKTFKCRSNRWVKNKGASAQRKRGQPTRRRKSAGKKPKGLRVKSILHMKANFGRGALRAT